jgi:hypothetical protein
MQDFPPPNPEDRAPKIKSTIRGGVPSAPRPLLILDKRNQPTAPPPYTDTDPTPPMGMHRPILKLSDADREKIAPKLSSLKKPRPTIKLPKD